MIELKRVNGTTTKVTVKRTKAELETDDNTFKVIVPKNANKQVKRYMRSMGIL